MYLLVRVLVSLQSFHDGKLSVVFKARRLIPQDFFQQTQSQGPDGVLRGAEAGRSVQRTTVPAGHPCVPTIKDTYQQLGAVSS